VSRLDDVADVMHCASERRTPAADNFSFAVAYAWGLCSPKANAGSWQADSKRARPRAVLNEDRDCDASVIRQVLNLKDYRGSLRHITRSFSKAKALCVDALWSSLVSLGRFASKRAP
jgi:hypothetical protein